MTMEREGKQDSLKVMHIVYYLTKAIDRAEIEAPLMDSLNLFGDKIELILL